MCWLKNYIFFSLDACLPSLALFWPSTIMHMHQFFHTVCSCSLVLCKYNQNGKSIISYDAVLEKKRKGFLCLRAFVCALKQGCLYPLLQSLCGWLLSLLFPPPLPEFLSFYLPPVKQITQTQKIPCEAEINAAIIYKQSQEMHKGEASMAREWVLLQRSILMSLLLWYMVSFTIFCYMWLCHGLDSNGWFESIHSYCIIHFKSEMQLCELHHYVTVGLNYWWNVINTDLQWKWTSDH